MEARWITPASGRWTRMGRALLVAVVVSLLAASVVARATPVDARTIGSNGQLAFDRNGGEAVFTINADGTNERKLFDAHCCPSWSPDGTRIVTPALTEDGRFTAATFDPDGGNYTVLPIEHPTLEAGCLAWSPDGERLLCVGGTSDGSIPLGVFTRRASDGRDIVRVTTNPHGALDEPGDFSPDGSRIVFLRSNPAKQGERAVFVVNADGSGVRQITPWGLAGCCTASWSPDGEWIAFDARWRLYLVRPDGTRLHRIVLHPGGRHFAYEPVWSPDGTRIAFSMWANGQDDIYTVDPDGSDLFQVTNTPEQEGQVDWGTYVP